MPFHNRQLPLPKAGKDNRYPLPLPPPPPPIRLPIPRAEGSSGSSDLEFLRGRLGPPWDYPRAPNANTQDQERRDGATHEAHQLDGHVQLPPLQAQDTQHSHSASQLQAIDDLLSPPRGRSWRRLPDPTQWRRSRSPARISTSEPFPTFAAQATDYLPTTESRTTTTSQEDIGFNNDSGHAARLGYSESGNMGPQQVDPRFNSEPSHANDGGVPLHAPSPRTSSLPKLLNMGPVEDLSTYPDSIRQALESSAYTTAQEPGSSSYSAQYELVQKDWPVDKQEPESENLVGTFNSRHTANIEAAKLFLHRFWVQVMEQAQGYETHIGEAGILTLDIETEDAQGGRKWVSVFVRRKGGPSRDRPEGGWVHAP